MAIAPLLEISAPDGFSPAPPLGAEPRLGFVTLGRLVVDSAYQRPVEEAGRRHVLAIASAFDWSKFGALVICPRGDGTFAIIDGQHRALAAQMAGIGKVPCIVIMGGVKAQARAFAAINGDVRPVTLFNIFRAALAAGEPWAADARDLAAHAGCRLMDYNRPNPERKAGEIYSIAFFRSLAEGGTQSARYQAAGEALKALRQCHDGEKPAAYAATVAQAWVMAVFLDTRAASAGWARLTGFLNANPPLGISAAASRAVEARSGQGHPTVSLLEQMTNDFADRLTAWFAK